MNVTLDHPILSCPLRQHITSLTPWTFHRHVISSGGGHGLLGVGAAPSEMTSGAATTTSTVTEVAKQAGNIFTSRDGGPANDDDDDGH